MQRAITALFALSTMMLGCVAAPPEDTAYRSPAEVQRDIENAVADHVLDLIAGDAVQSAMIYTEDVIVRPAGAPPVQGRAAMRDFMSEFFRGFSVLQADYVTEELTLQGDTAWIFGRYTWVMQPLPDGEPVTDRGDFLVKWVHGADGAWRIHRNISNSWRVAEAGN